MEPPQKKTECLVVTNSEEANSAHAYNEIQGIFSQLKVRADYVDLSREELPAYDAYEKVVLAAEDYDQLGARASDLMDWVGNGGNLMIFFPPQAGSVFQSISAGLGIREVGREMYELPGIRMKTDFLLGGKGKDFMVEEPYESSLSLSLNEDCTVHIVSADDRELPVLWERKYKDGTIVFDNFGIMEKAYRGIHAAGYSLLGEAFAWPVINGSSFYLDDFPSPVPSGASEYIQRDYGISVKDFYTNVWWPDLLKLSEKYGCRYNGMVIEDYNDQVEAPFKPNQNIQRFQYFGSSLLKNGGEIGLHGYNHIPLCLKGFDKASGTAMYREPTIGCSIMVIGIQKKIWKPPCMNWSVLQRNCFHRLRPVSMSLLPIFCPKKPEAYWLKNFRILRPLPAFILKAMWNIPRILRWLPMDSWKRRVSYPVISSILIWKWRPFPS